MLNWQPQTGDMASYRRRKEKPPSSSTLGRIKLYTFNQIPFPTDPILVCHLLVPSPQIQGSPDPSATDAPLSSHTHTHPLTSNITHGLSPLRSKQLLRQRASQPCRPTRKASIALPTRGMHIESCFSVQNTPLYFVYSLVVTLEMLSDTTNACDIHRRFVLMGVG